MILLTKSVGPISNTKSFAAVRYKTVRAFVSSLLLLCSPATVAWRVVSVVVNSIKSMLLGWGIAHVRQKCSEIRPFRGNLDSTTGPILPPSASGVHCLPALIGVSFMESVSSSGCASSLSLKAPAGVCGTVADIFTGRNFFSSAFAPTKPVRSAVNFSSIRNYSKSLVPKSGHINLISHMRIIPNFATDFWT